MSQSQHDARSFDLSILPSLPLFSGVPSDCLKTITADMVRYYANDEAICKQHDEAHNLIILLHGSARVFADDTYLVTRQPFEVIGEQAFIQSSPRTATVLAQGAVKALVLPRSLVERLMENVNFVKNLLKIVSDKLTQATDERAFRYRNEQLLFSEFRAHVSDMVAQRILAAGVDYGKPRYVDGIILFADIRDFTSHSSTLSPGQIAHQLSRYLDAVVEVIHTHEGLVDKFVGDAVMAVWGFDVETSDMAARAFACAREIVVLAGRMYFAGKPIQVGVGLNAGRIFIGNIGGEGKRQFTVLGSPVNLAARFESETKTLHAPIVMGEVFYALLGKEDQAVLTAHPDQAIRGGEAQTLYTYGPTDARKYR